MKLERDDIEVIAAVLGWADTGFKQLGKMTVEDAGAVADFIGTSVDGKLDQVTTEEMREGLRDMRADISRVRNKLKTLYSV